MGDTAWVTWEGARIAQVAHAYRRHGALSTGSREQRLAAEDGPDLWAVDLVHEACDDGTLPIEVIDEMLHDPDGGGEFRGSVAAGPLEDLLHAHPAAYANVISERCRRDPLWVEALRGVWLDRPTWDQLPEQLQRYVPEPKRSSDTAEPSKHKRPRRPSKRQGPQDRHEGTPGRRT